MTVNLQNVDQHHFSSASGPCDVTTIACRYRLMYGCKRAHESLQTQGTNIISGYYLWFTEEHSTITQKWGLSVDSFMWSIFKARHEQASICSLLIVFQSQCYMAVPTPVPETSNDAETITLSTVASPLSSSSNFDGKIKVVMVTPKREFWMYFEESEFRIVRPAQESSEAMSSAELVINMVKVCLN